ncbi:MAG: hypothetical protein PHC61_04365 [Chitinivibrionales bacterium]|nr:hypothetical protein [Chitinivibrionales bacterium]
MRTTISIDQPLFRRIKAISYKEHKPLTRVIGELLIRGLREKKRSPKPSPIRWYSHDMAPRFDYRDKDALYKALEE